MDNRLVELVSVRERVSELERELAQEKASHETTKKKLRKIGMAYRRNLVLSTSLFTGY